MTGCLCCNGKAEHFISSKSYPLCNDCSEEWRKIVHENFKKFNSFRGDTKEFHKFWNELWNKFLQKGKEKVLFT
jgi:predicted transcriptional regulator YdeE